jgi:hypothetical protein
LSNNSLYSAGVDIADCLRENTRLTRLDVSCNFLYDAGIEVGMGVVVAVVIIVVKITMVIMIIMAR